MNKNLINFQKINNRYEEIKGLLVDTPLLQSDEINSLFSSNIFFKAENLQKTGSFKFRGACSAISSLSKEQIKSGVVCFSSGNHAQGIALAAKLHKTTAKIIMPKDAPKIKIQNTKKYKKHHESKYQQSTRKSQRCRGSSIIQFFTQNPILNLFIWVNPLKGRYLAPLPGRA